MTINTPIYCFSVNPLHKLEEKDLEVFKRTFEVVFIGRIHFNAKFFVTSISHHFQF